MLNETLEYLENEEVKKIVLFLRQSSLFGHSWALCLSTAHGGH